MTLQLGFLLYPGLTQLDLTGPFEVLSRIRRHQPPDLEAAGVVQSDTGLGLVANRQLRRLPGPRSDLHPRRRRRIKLMEDDDVLDFVARRGAEARWVTSVARLAGPGRRRPAARLPRHPHWAFMPLLAAVRCHRRRERVVIDRNRITAGGVTAGIDSGSGHGRGRRRDLARTTELYLGTTRRRRSAPAIPGAPRQAGRQGAGLGDRALRRPRGPAAQAGRPRRAADRLSSPWRSARSRPPCAHPPAKSMIDMARHGLERMSRLAPNDLLHRLLNDAALAWLRLLSELIVRMDEWLDDELRDPTPPPRAARHRELLVPADDGDEFARNYAALLQRSPTSWSPTARSCALGPVQSSHRGRSRARCQ
jgi:putative intracellular protease/amidase